MLRRYTSAFAGSLAVHAGIIAAIVWLLAPPRLLVEAPPARAVAVVLVPPEDARFPGLKPLEPAAALVRGLRPEDRKVSVGGFTFDAGKIADRAEVLFPFVAPGVALEYFGLRPPGALIFMREAPAQAAGADRSRYRPLALSDAALQAVIDKSWARRERWTGFETVRALTYRYSPNEGQLPAVLQRYTDQNALQPYRDKEDPDPRLWAQLGIAADHVYFIGFIRRYAAEHPSTRATTELLFLLDRIAEASQDALVALLAIDPEKDLRWTREANVKAYHLAVRLRGHYRGELSRRGLASPAALKGHYDAARLAILNGIVRTTPSGYRLSDARFLIGTILWRQGRLAEALESWRNLACAPSDSYIAACTQMARVLPRTGGGSVDPMLTAHIERVLKNEQVRWYDFSYDRLKRFGYSFDSY